MNPWVRSIYRSAGFFGLLAVALVGGLLGGTAFDAQHKSWSRDSFPAMKATPAWQPFRRYEPRIETALRIMGTVEPARLRFLRERGIPVMLVSDRQMKQAGCGESDWGCTSIQRSEMYVNSSSRLSPAELAAILSHELLHCQRHDPFLGVTRRPLWSRLLLGDEESDAHRANLRAARLLHLSLWHGGIGGLWLDYVLWFWPLGTMTVAAITMHYACTGAVQVQLGLSRSRLRQLQRERWLLVKTRVSDDWRRNKWAIPHWR